MPLLFPPGTRVCDDDGNPVNDAQVRVYTQNTTSHASLFSDPGLTVPLTNPVITNAAGYPTSDGSNECLIWVAAGDYDVAFLTSGGSVMANWDDATTFGEEGGTIERTLSGNGRFKVTGAAGAVMIQVGDPDPDDVGGTLTIEGQAGTQGDSLTLDFATTNTTGTFTENGKKLSGVVYSTTTFSGAQTADIALPAGYRAYLLEFIDLHLSTDTAGLQCRMAYQGGAVKSGASDYAYIGTANAAQILLAADPEIDANPGYLRIMLITPDSGTDPTIIDSRLAGYDSTETDPEIFHQIGYGKGSYGRCTTFQLRASAGNVSGICRVTPQRGYGEA